MSGVWRTRVGTLKAIHPVGSLCASGSARTSPAVSRRTLRRNAAGRFMPEPLPLRGRWRC